MAEARSAAAFPIVTLLHTEEGVSISLNGSVVKGIAQRVGRSVMRRCFLVRNAVKRNVWPASPSQLLLVSALVFAVLQAGFAGDNWPMWAAKHAPRSVALTEPVSAVITALTACSLAFLVLALMQRAAIRVLLRFQGWLFYEPGAPIPWHVKLWGLALKAFTWHSPITFSYQRLLPKLSVPALEDTVAKWLRSVRPLMNDKEYAEAELKAQKFLNNEGPKLQRYLWLKSWISENYVSDWWEKYVYLSGRSPIAINSNYYGLDSAYYKPTPNQAARAARIAYGAVQFKLSIDRETLPPQLLQGAVPVCMSQYERMFGCVRVPEKECDAIVHHNTSRHCAVFSNGIWYTLPLWFPTTGRIVPVWMLEEQMNWILTDSKINPITAHPEEQNAATLTGSNRDLWADTRKLFMAQPTSARSLKAVETALFCLILEDHSPENLTHQGKLLLHGSGSNRWFDKSINFVVFQNGYAGLNAEHTWADAPVVAHCWETISLGEFRNAYDPQTGRNIEPPGERDSLLMHEAVSARRLEWKFSPEIIATIDAQLADFRTRADDLDLHIKEVSGFSKSYIKSIGVSPDGFLQMGMQLAYYLDSLDEAESRGVHLPRTAGKFCLTYESSMTRLFLKGRTETVRPLTIESKAFVEAVAARMLDDKPPAEEKAEVSICELFRRATQYHQLQSRRCMVGGGIDRHLFALFVVSMGKNIPSEFLKEILTMKWILSTSQQPQVQTTLWNPFKNAEDAKKICPGGGFGPVADNGYGVSYMIASNDIVYFHISSKHSCAATSSKRFGKNLDRAFALIKQAFDTKL